MIRWKDLADVEAEDLAVSNFATLRIFNFEVEDPEDKEIRWESFFPEEERYNPKDAKCKIFDEVMEELFADIDKKWKSIPISAAPTTTCNVMIINTAANIHKVLSNLMSGIDTLIDAGVYSCYMGEEEDDEDLYDFFSGQVNLNDPSNFIDVITGYLEVKLIPQISSKGDKKTLHSFILKHHCYNQFCAALDQQNKVHFSQLVKKGLNFRTINEAFDWSKTEEGFDFWYELDKKWKDGYGKYFVSPNKTNQHINKENRTMKTLRNTISTSITLGKDAAKIAVDIEKGTLGLKLIKDQLIDFLPEKANILLNTTEGDYVLAHVVAAVLDATKPIHKLYDVADDISKCLVTAASTKELGKFNLPEKISDLAAAMGINAGTAVNLIKTKTKGKKEKE